MKSSIFLYLSTAVIFLLNTAVCCEEMDDDETIKQNILSIEICNINNEGEKPIVSDESIKKEAYMIGIRYLVEEDSETALIRFDDIKEEQIVSDINIGDEYPAGSDISSLFFKTTLITNPLDAAFILKKPIPAGTYSFKVILTTTEDKIFEAVTNPINLY